MKEVNPNLLINRVERATAKLARIARCDVFFGGARAFVLAKRMKFKHVPAMEVVSAAYTDNLGNARDYLAYACDECGQAHLGINSAMNCCNDEIQ